MKKLFIILLGSFLLAVSINAQPGGGGFTRRTPEERAAAIHQKLDSAFHLDAAVLSKMDTALTALFKASDVKRQELFSGSTPPDRETMQKEMKPYNDAQDDILKTLLTKDQYETWKEKIQPSMRPQRPPGGGGNN